jgi:hypothetical protein
MSERTESELRPDEPPRRPACPMCGSTRTQPFTHAGPAARVNMKCTNPATSPVLYRASGDVGGQVKIQR